MFDVLDDLEDAIDKIAASEELLDVARISKLAERLDFERVRAVSGFDRSGAWAAENYVSTAAALRDKTRCSDGHSYRTVRLARRLGDLPETSAAFASGSITREHVDIITRRCTPKRLELFQRIEAGLLTIARDHTYADLESAVQRYVDQFDGLGNDDDDETELNKVTLSSSLEGRGYLNGSLDPEMTEIVKTAFDAEMEVLRQKGETRTTPQLRADAFASICRQYLAFRGQRDAHGRGQSHLAVIVDIAKFADAHPDLVEAVRAEFAHGGRLSRTTLERITCDCRISRVIMDGPSAVLDVGRTQRTVTNAQRNAWSHATTTAPNPAAPSAPLLRSPPHPTLGTRRPHPPRKPPTLMLAPPPHTTHPRRTSTTRIGRDART